MDLPGYHEEIRACPKHSKDYADGEFFRVYYKGQEQFEMIEMPNGRKAFLCPIDNNKTDDFRLTYAAQFTCFTSCLKGKNHRADQLALCFALICDNVTKWDKRELIQITANPGRDSGVFRGKRKSDEKIEAPSPLKIKREIDTDVSICAMENLRAQIAGKVAGKDQNEFMETFERFMKGNLELQLNEYKLKNHFVV